MYTRTMDNSGRELMDALRSLLVIGRYSDLTIVCGERQYAVHKSVLCSQSSFFQGACNNPFREQETGIIDLSREDPQAVEHMINYLYDSDYLRGPRSLSRRSTHRGRSRGASFRSIDSSINSRPTSECGTSTFNSRPMSPITPPSPTSSTFSRRKLNLPLVEDPLLAIAASNVPKAHPSPYMSRFGPTSPLLPPDSPLLRKERFEPQPPMDTFITESEVDNYYDVEEIPEQEPDLATPHLVTHAKVYALAEQYGISPLKLLAKKKFAAQVPHHHESSEFANALREVYETTIETDRGLREVALQVFRQYPNTARRRDVGEAVKEIPGLAWELFRVGWGLPT